MLHLSEDAWQGDAQFAVALDGQVLGSAQAVTALHDASQTQDFAFTGSFGAGAHDLSVVFLNDAWDGTWNTDRNLHVNGIAYDGASLVRGTADLFSNGAAHFQIPALTGV